MYCTVHIPTYMYMYKQRNNRLAQDEGEEPLPWVKGPAHERGLTAQVKAPTWNQRWTGEQVG